jgi:hypothetical protein
VRKGDDHDSRDHRSSVITAVVLWLPTKIVKYGLRWMMGTEESLDDLAVSINLAANQAIAEYLKTHPC